LSSKDLVETLKKSRSSLAKELYPVLEAADGEVIDGFHRLEAGWESKRVLPNVKTRLEKLVARALAHHRRTMTFRERRELYDNIAEELIKEGFAVPEPSPNLPPEKRDKPKVIPKVAELLCVSEHSVAQYISDKYKRGTIWRKEELPKGKKKRSFFEIRGEILEVLGKEKEGIKPTRLMYKTNLSWRPLMKHFSFLYSKGLIDVSGEGSPRYFLTEKGHDILRRYEDLKGWLLIGP